ncbi:DUF1295 domain-containing protein [Rubinisphaera margarita]|uniref:DUF1295 domain-containing protein n=1 Tax=Rubinisphaera margarita TaxID=2909586 RepID=UPI001EE91082|nr:DUF1295 domain-containing protein [Rubinisphaera margarita]MCG6155206.1 DUF1295 domain-containing protein [Rubinisphaera margarita]
MTILLANAAAILTLMLLVWLISIPLRNVSIIDPVWGLGFVIVAWVTYLMSVQTGEVCYLLPVLVAIWGLRLFGYLAWRSWGEEEDKRYAEMRARRPDNFWWISLFMVFLLQGVLMWIISLPLQLGIPRNPGVVNVWTFLGTGLWMIGFFFEVIGDWQMARFKANPENQGEVLNSGLWRYTRHPNYFGEFCLWWGFWVLSISAGGPYWTVISPINMSFLLLHVSGVTLLERHMRKDKPKYEEYTRRTNAFFPWFPRTESAAT